MAAGLLVSRTTPRFEPSSKVQEAAAPLTPDMAEPEAVANGAAHYDH